MTKVTTVIAQIVTSGEEQAADESRPSMALRPRDGAAVIA